MVVCWQAGWSQKSIEAIRDRYASYKNYIATHTGTNQYDGGEWAEYYHIEVRQTLPGTGGHMEDVYMYWDEKESDDLVYPPHYLTFATTKYNFAARVFYEEYMFDIDGNPEFIYAYDPLWAPGESTEDAQYEFRFYLSKGKLIKAVIKKRTADDQPYTDVFSGTSLKKEFAKVFSNYKANAARIKQLFIHIEDSSYSYSE